jgi:IS5 family transposase
MQIIKKAKSMFDEDNKLYQIDKLGDPLIQLSRQIKWESFRESIESIFPTYEPAKGGRPNFDRLMMFKILILQRYYDLSDDSMEYQLNDRLTFMRFLGLGLGDKVPDAKTIWLFKEQLIQCGKLDELFVLFTESLHNSGLVMNKGVIMDATITEARVQRNTREENKQIRSGIEPSKWEDNKKRQKDMDADWTEKGGKRYFGYKNHVTVDKETKIITNFEVTPASVTDREIGEEFIDEMQEVEEIYADKGYPSKRIDEKLAVKGIANKIMSKGSRNVKLSEEAEVRNKTISRIRCRVEHIFGYIKRGHKKYLVMSVGLVRATAQITLMNLVYNMSRAIKIIKTRNLHIELAI